MNFFLFHNRKINARNMLNQCSSNYKMEKKTLIRDISVTRVLYLTESS